MKLNIYPCVSGSCLKMIAITTMLIDHIGYHILRFMPEGHRILYTLGHRTVTLYDLSRGVGRMAFPIFAFLIVEGYLHTRDRMRYGRNLLLFAFISEIPWNLVYSNSLFHPTKQNVFFTLFLGFLAICAADRLRTDFKRQAVCLLSILAVSFLLRADYGCGGLGFILMLYVLREERIWKAVIGTCFLPSTWRAGLAFIPISLYNGQRGFVRGRWLKYAFYIFYPAHLFVLYLLKLHLFAT